MTDQAPPIRSRTRQPAAITSAQTPTPRTNQGGDWMKSGASARETAQSELARNQEREAKRAAGIYMPWRLWLPVGKQVEVVVLDTELGPCFYEHNLQNPATGKWDTFESCPKEFEHCPLCDGVAGGKESYYVMMLTVMVLDPYINKNGVTVPHSRKLLPVKTNDQPFWQRQFEDTGSLRGRQYLMVRDSKDQSNTGRPEYLNQQHGEDTIIASFGHPAITDQQGKVLKQANTDCYPFPYAQLFTRPSGEDLRRRYGGAPPVGSRASNAAIIGATGGITPISSGAASIQTGGTPGADLDDDSVPF